MIDDNGGPALRMLSSPAACYGHARHPPGPRHVLSQTFSLLNTTQYFVFGVVYGLFDKDHHETTDLSLRDRHFYHQYVERSAPRSKALSVVSSIPFFRMATKIGLLPKQAPGYSGLLPSISVAGSRRDIPTVANDPRRFIMHRRSDSKRLFP